MTYKKSKFFPFLLTIIIIVIVIYLFANIEQTSVKCSKKVVEDDNIVVTEELITSLEGRKINNFNFKKSIILPEKYLKDNKYIDYVAYTIGKSYEYLGKDKVKVSKLSDRVVIRINLKDKGTLILNNIDFIVNDDLDIKINTNTKSSGVVTLTVNDNYTQGELIKHMKNNGYTCG